MNQRNLTLVEDALSCIKKNELDQAQILLLRVLQDNPNDSEILRLLSVVAALKSDFVTALELIDRVLSLTHGHGVAYSNKGNILKQLGRYEEALSNYDRAIQLMPDYVESYNNKANTLQDLHCFEDALVWYDKAIALNPQYVEAYSNKGNALVWIGRYQEAMNCFDMATSIDPHHIEAYWQKGLSQLANGQFELGWQNYEARWSRTNPVKFEYLEIPRLVNIDDIAGKRILIWAEQGLGDTIQFCRYINPLSRTGAKLTFLVPEQLMNILSPIQKFCDLKSMMTFQPREFDFQSPLLSLPLLFGTTLESIPCEIPYLNADRNKKELFKASLQTSSNLKVGVVWSGGFRLLYSDGYLAGCRRNIAIEQIASLNKIPGIDFYSLQKGDPAESELLLKKDQVWPDIFNFAHLIHDFTDTAALIESMDLIISVDTSTAHLAGALGKSTWILNRYDSCWRWLRGREDSPWYPTVKIFHQRNPGDWSEVIDRVRVELVKLIESR